MALERFIGFIGPTYQARSVNFDAQRTINLYPEMDELGTGKNQEVAALVGTPGLKKLSTLANGPIRGLYYASKARTFAVSGSSFYEVTDPANPVLRGTITTSAGRIVMTDNGVDLVLADGAKGYTFRFSTNVFAQITDPDFPPGANVAQFLDQYIIVNEPGTGRFWFSAISDATNWSALDFGNAEGAPDKLLTLFVDHRELWLVGDRTIEVFFNSGDFTNPFQRIQGAFIEEGGIAGTLAKIDNTVFYVHVDERGRGIVKRAQGYIPQRISTHAVEIAIASYGDISGATSYTYQEKGHSFYVLNFPGAPVTWIFDASTGLWHERQSMVNGAAGRHRAENHVFDGTRHLVGDFENGNLYEMTDSEFTDDGQPIRRVRRAPHISQNGHRIVYRTFQVDLEAGAGLATGQGNDPQVMLRYSADGGHTFSNERLASAGKQGKYAHRAIWRRLGSDRDRVFEVSISDPVKVVLVGAFLDVEAGAH